MTGLHNSMIGKSPSPSSDPKWRPQNRKLKFFKEFLNNNNNNNINNNVQRDQVQYKQFLGHQCIFASVLARYTLSAATLDFLGSGLSMALVGLLQDETRSGKPKMATYEMVLVICQLLDEIETKFRRLDLHFRGPAFEWDKFKYCPTKPEVKNQIYQPPNRKNLYLSFQMR